MIMTRRSLLTTAATTAALTATGTAIAGGKLPAGNDARLIELERQRAELIDSIKGDQEDDVVDEIADEITEVEEQMIATQATTAEGVRVKIRMVGPIEALGLGPNSLNEKMLASFIADVERMMAGGAV
jgi:hypothetical protein